MTLHQIAVWFRLFYSLRVFANLSLFSQFWRNALSLVLQMVTLRILGRTFIINSIFATYGANLHGYITYYQNRGCFLLREQTCHVFVSKHLGIPVYSPTPIFVKLFLAIST